jgi:tetratricopeptide (TPR) repeat protein
MRSPTRVTPTPPLPPVRRSLNEAAFNRAITYRACAGAYKAKGDKHQAIADYTKAIEANSRYADAYAARGIVYQIIGKNDDAISDYSKAIEIDPRKADTGVGRGVAYRLKRAPEWQWHYLT